MHDLDFSHPQRQSRVGLVLIFGTALFRVIRSLWVLIVYFLVKDPDPKMLLLLLFGLFGIVLLALFYSIAAYLNFKFHIDQKNREFVLQKGVFSTDVINIPFEKIQQVNFRRNILQRIIGVYSVVIETAGSQEKEIEIKALYQGTADRLSERLMELKQEEVKDREEVTEALEDEKHVPDPQWKYNISLRTLFKLGLTSNFLRGVTLILAFYFTLREQFMLEEILPSELPGQQMLEKGSLLFILGLLLLGILITVGDTFIKYYGLSLRKYQDSLQVEMGLRNNTKVSLKQKRVQMIEISTHPVQQLMRLYTLKISLASSQDDLKKSQIKIPGLPPRVVQSVKEFFLEGKEREKLVLGPHSVVFWRRFSKGSIPAVIGLVAALLLQEKIPSSILAMGAGAYLVLFCLYSYASFKRLKLSVSEEMLVKQSGLWFQRKQYIELYRLQAVSVRQPLWYKRRRIVNITFHSAGGDLHFSGLDQDRVNMLVDFLIYKIEKTSRSWM